MSGKVTMNSAAMQDLMRLSADCNEGKVGAEQALKVRVAELVKNQGVLDFEQLPNKDTSSFSWSAIAAGGAFGAFVLGLTSYAAGFFFGRKDIIDRLPENQADEIKAQIEAETIDRLNQISWYS